MASSQVSLSGRIATNTSEDATAHHAHDDDRTVASGHEPTQPTSANPWSNQEKEDPFLVKFEEGDPDNPMVRPDHR